eukprot:scaffold107070_cov72-Phaeocystis_antarctica.AAC.10
MRNTSEVIVAAVSGRSSASFGESSAPLARATDASMAIAARRNQVCKGGRSSERWGQAIRIDYSVLSLSFTAFLSATARNSNTHYSSDFGPVPSSRFRIRCLSSRLREALLSQLLSRSIWSGIRCASALT